MAGYPKISITEAFQNASTIDATIKPQTGYAITMNEVKDENTPAEIFGSYGDARDKDFARRDVYVKTAKGTFIIDTVNINPGGLYLQTTYSEQNSHSDRIEQHTRTSEVVGLSAEDKKSLFEVAKKFRDGQNNESTSPEAASTLGKRVTDSLKKAIYVKKFELDILYKEASEEKDSQSTPPLHYQPKIHQQPNITSRD